MSGLLAKIENANEPNVVSGGEDETLPRAMLDAAEYGEDLNRLIKHV